NKNIEIKLNKEHKDINDKECDFYVLATGGKPRLLDIKGGYNSQIAAEIIKNLKEKKSVNLGNKICIIGLGNVTLDLVWWLRNKRNKITVFCRSSSEEAA